MTLNIIVAATSGINGLTIGHDDKLLWHLPKDMQRFRELTMSKGGVVLMGRATFETLPEKYRPLPGRTNVVLTRNPSWSHPGVEVVRSLHDARRKYQDLWVAGGADVYAQAMDAALTGDSLYMTWVYANLPGNKKFPHFGSVWRERYRVENRADEKHKYNFDFVWYEYAW